MFVDGAGMITFEAFGLTGESLGRSFGSHTDNSFDGTTVDDRFYGVVNFDGISSILISTNGGSGLEIDHLQWGRSESVRAGCVQ